MEPPPAFPKPIGRSIVNQNDVDANSLLLGRYIQTPTRNENLDDPDATSQGGGFAISGGASHLLTIAPAAAGRVSSCIIPNLLTYPGSMVVVDLTGEAFTVTSRAREEMGHTVVRLDPFRVIDQESDALNPLDLLEGLPDSAIESTCHDIAGLFPSFNTFNDVWENAAFGLMSGVVGYIAAVPEKNKFADIYSTFHSDDVVYNLAVVLDTIGKQIPKMAYSEIAHFLQKADAERSRILTAITSQLKALGSPEAQKALGTSTFSLSDFIEGKPVTIYLMIPPAKVMSHFSLLRIWIGTLLHGVMRQRTRPEFPTVFLLDECEKLGSFSQLEAAMTSSGKSGFRLWTFWHDLHQLRSLYPGSWLMNNCGVTQVFGQRDYSASIELAAMLGIEADDIRLLTADEQIVSHNGSSQTIKQIDYPTDPVFVGKFDSGT